MSMKMSMKMASKKMMSAKMAMKKMSMKKMAMKKVSKVGRKHAVLKGNKEKTVGGLKKSDLKLNKQGKVVSKKRSDNAKKHFKNRIAPWANAFKAARKALGIKGFVPNGGKTKRGQELLAKTRSLYKKSK